MTAPKNLPGVGVGKTRRRAAPHTTAAFWAVWLVCFCAFVAWQLFL